MRKCAVLVACLIALQGAARADHHRSAFGGCLGDGAYQKASGRSAIETQSERSSSGSSWTDRNLSADPGPDLENQNNTRRMREEMPSRPDSGALASYQTGSGSDSLARGGSGRSNYDSDCIDTQSGIKKQSADQTGAEKSPQARMRTSSGSSWRRFGSRLGDGALSKASGRSELELQLSRAKGSEDLSDNHAEWVPVDRSQSLSESLSETERLSPAETPVSTETQQGLQAQGIPASTEVGTSDSFESFPEVARVNPDFGDTYDTEISPDLQDFSLGDLGGRRNSSDPSAQGAPAASESGKASSNSSAEVSTSNSAPIDANGTADISGNSLARPASAMDRELSSRIMRDLTNESPENTSAQTFTSEGLRNVQFKSVNGMVTIQGSVRSDMEKKNLESRVKQMNGVVSVNNQLQVVPGLGPDHLDLRNNFSLPDEYPPKD